MSTGAGVTRQSNRDLMVISALLAAAFIIFPLWMAAHNHYNTRNQHLGGAVEYAKGHIDLLRPMLLGFTVNGTPTPLEFPIWQASTAVLMKCFGLWYGWGNVVSLAFFLSSLWPLFDLSRRMGSSRVGWWAVIFTLIQPLSWAVGAEAGGDSTAWTFAAWFIYASYRMMSERKWVWWLFSLCVAALSAVTKAPFFAAAGLTTFFWLLLYYRRSGRAWFFLISAGVIGILIFFAWNLHCNRVYAEAEFSTLNLDPLAKQGSINEWYFETLAYRLHLANWLRGGWHLTNYVFGGFALIFLCLVTIRLKQSIPAWVWLAGAACASLVFPALILEHIHYFFIFAPATAWLCALGAIEIEAGIQKVLPLSTPLRTVFYLATLVISLIQALGGVYFNTKFDSYNQDIGDLIKAHTAPNEKIVVWGMNWGDPFLTADRQGFTGGLSLGDDAWFDDPQKLKRLKQLGYTKVVLINWSPVTIALTAITVHTKADVNNHVRKLENLHNYVPAIAQNWPVVFESPYLLIVQIPDSPPDN